LLYDINESYYFHMKNGSKSILQPLPVKGDLQGLIREASEKTHLSQAEVMRQALRIGVPELLKRFQPPLPEGALTDYYAKMPEERVKWENAYGRAVKQRPER